VAKHAWTLNTTGQFVNCRGESWVDDMARNRANGGSRLTHVQFVSLRRWPLKWWWCVLIYHS